MSELREALDDAWEDGGDDEGGLLAPASEVLTPEDAQADGEVGEHEDEVSQSPVDEAERQYAPGQEPDADGEHPAGSEEATKESSEGAEAGASVGAGDAGETAPIGWSPEAREGWAAIPKATKDQILQRERDIEQNMANTNLARQESQVLNQIASKYGAVMAAEGVTNHFQAIDGMFQTAAKLRMGSPEAKADQIRRMIQTYGVDVELLDSMLVGEQPQNNPNAQVSQMIDQRMAPVNQMMQQLAGMQQIKQNEQHAGANAQVGQFAQTAEFINDVRYDMADLMDLATKRGQSLSLQEAYDRACSVHPQVSAVLAKRQEQESLITKQKAGLSINGSGQEAAPNTANNTLGQDVRAAWDAYR